MKVSKNVKTHRGMIRAAFRQLEKEGFTARMNLKCCQTCAWAALDVKDRDNVIFYHGQDNDALGRSGVLNARGMYMAHSGKVERAVEVLREAGLNVVWNGSRDIRIKVIPHVWCGMCGKGTMEAAGSLPDGWARFLDPKGTVAGVICTDCASRKKLMFRDRLTIVGSMRLRQGYAAEYPWPVKVEEPCCKGCQA